MGYITLHEGIIYRTTHKVGFQVGTSALELKNSLKLVPDEAIIMKGFEGSIEFLEETPKGNNGW